MSENKSIILSQICQFCRGSSSLIGIKTVRWWLRELIIYLFSSYYDAEWESQKHSTEVLSFFTVVEALT